MKLANQLRRALFTALPPNFNAKLPKALDSAIKFELDFDPLTFQKNAFPDVEKYLDIAAIFAKLPAELCWIEHSIDLANRDTGPTAATRAGYLLRSDGERIYVWPSLLQEDGRFSSANYEKGINPKDGWSYTMLNSPYYQQRLDREMADGTDNTAICFSVVTALCIINSPGITQSSEHIVKEPITKRRAATKLPLYTHKVITLKFGQAQVQSKAAGSERKDIYRAHMVRGHYKLTPKSGFRWWKPFIRGNSKLGIITKDYQVRALQDCNKG